MKDFKIPYKGLSIGVHNYHWEIDRKFFEAIENPEFADGCLTVLLDLEKQERMMTLTFSIRGSVVVACDRCLENLDLPLAINEDIYIKFGSERNEEDDNVIILPESEYQIDISRLINEFITLAMPLKKAHQKDDKGAYGCNKEVLKKLEELSEKRSVDPRWEKLKDIKLD
ncbi:MAG: DUF177 domain-containing protein [Bacteroidales bacterium]